MTTSASGSTTLHVDAIPTDLRTLKQWVIWRYGTPRQDGKRSKQPYTPQTGTLAKTNDPTTWGTFDEALAQYRADNYDGIGFMFAAPYVGVDLDKCRDAETGELADWADDIVSCLDSYTELSPSETGLHILARGTLPPQGRKRGGIELYDGGRYFTVTGQRLAGTPAEVEEREAALWALHAQVFPSPAHNETSDYPAPASADLSDQEILIHCRRGRNAARFQRLWEGDTSDYDDDHSRADGGLCAMLARWTDDPVQIDRLFRRSGLYRAKWGEPHRGDGATYGEVTIEKVLGSTTRTASTGTRASQQPTVYTYPWQQRQETPRDRAMYLDDLAERMRGVVRRHLDAREAGKVLVVAAPPGLGKSRVVAALGAHSLEHSKGEYNLAWIAPRKDMIASVPELQRYHERVRCTLESCLDAELHDWYAKLGYNTWAVHKRHPVPCAYMRQVEQQGSTVYQIPHVATPYPLQHSDGIIIDELDPTQWLEERQITIGELTRAAAAYQPETTADMLLRAVQAILTDAAQQGTQPYGPELLDALDAHCNRQLVAWFLDLQDDEDVWNTRPWEKLDQISAYARMHAKMLPPVVLPHILHALKREFRMFVDDDEWNSCMRIAPASDKEHKGELALCITEPRQFIEPAMGTLPPRVLLDATADKELLSHLFNDDRVIIARPMEEVLPPPHTRHVQIRYRYSKTSLVSNPTDRARTIRQIRHVLKVTGVDPDGSRCQAGEVGLITFQGCEKALREALGIPVRRSMHFFGARGSNVLEDCPILLVVGTPALPPDEVLRLAKGLWRHDEYAIEPGSVLEEGLHYYIDTRVQRLSDYLTHAELTQCAHRNRPLRHDGRAVLTFSTGEVEYLPVTHEFTELPRLTEDGERQDVERQAEGEAALKQAAGRIYGRGETPTVRKLIEEVREMGHPLRNQTVQHWWASQRDD